MKFKYYLRGIGIGIVFASIIFLAAYRDNVPSKMTDAEVIERAKQLGMVEADGPIKKLIDGNTSEDKHADASKENGNTAADQEEIKQEGNDQKNDQSGNGEGTAKVTAENTDNEKSDEKTEAENTKEATTEKESTDKTESKETTTEKESAEKTEAKDTEEKTTEKATTEAISTKDNDKNTTESTSKNNNTAEAEAASGNVENKTESVELTVSRGTSSYPVCQKLVSLGIIEDASDFDNYLIENGYATRIRVGTHKLTKGMDYHAIAEAISDPK